MNTDLKRTGAVPFQSSVPCDKVRGAAYACDFLQEPESEVQEDYGVDTGLGWSSVATSLLANDASTMPVSRCNRARISGNGMSSCFAACISAK